MKVGKYSVSEVAEKVGISDVKYFGKLFSPCGMGEITRANQ